MIKFKNYVFIILILILFLNISNIKSQFFLSSSEYNCLLDLSNKYINSITIPKNGSGYYNFCFHDQDELSIGCEGVTVRSLDLKPFNNIVFEPKDIACFSNIKILRLTNPYGASVSDLLLYSSYGSVQLTTISLLSMDSTVSGGTSISLPNTLIKNFMYITISIENQLSILDVKFSIFNKFTSLTIKSNINLTSSFPVIYTNDLKSLQTFYLIDIAANDFPNFKNIQTTNPTLITLLSGYNKASLNTNILTITNLGIVKIYGIEGDISPFPTNIKSIVSTNVRELHFYMNFEKPTGLIDISTKTNAPNLKVLILNNVGKDFNYNGGIPIKIRTDIESFEFSNGDITSFNIRDFYTTYKNLLFFKFSYNNWSGPLGTWDKNFVLQSNVQILSIDVSHNKIAGTIDESFCDIYVINVKNNSLSGDIPSCFTCFFDNSDLKSSFSLNSFTNFDSYPPCTTIVPNLIRIDSMSDEFVSRFYLFGKDLGGSYSKPQIMDPLTNIKYELVGQKGNLYWFVISTYNENDKYIALPSTLELSFPTYPKLSKYTLATLPTSPKLQYASTDNTGAIFTFNGSFMTYNISIISIQVNGQDCITKSSPTFYVLSCSVSNAVTIRTPFIVVMKIGTVASQITMYSKTMNNLISCPGDCGYFSGKGYCDSQVGACVCNQGYQSSDCSLPYKECPVYNNQVCNAAGTCNNQTGICTCDSNHQSSDCSIPYKACPSVGGKICSGFGSCDNILGLCTCDLGHENLDCSGIICNPSCSSFGICNSTTGKCECDSSHQGPTCSTSFIQCPIVNNKVCSGAGSCNNQTGVCTCDSSHQSIDCSLPFIQCPIVNNKVCNGAGSCNTQTGVCTCDSSHQGSSCSAPFIQCPIINNKVCNGAGSCNTQTGVCTCDSSHQGSSCSTPFIQCPIVNNKVCSGSGSCNTQTGVCTCDSSHQGSSCSAPFIECPTVNNKICSDSGSCNTQTGVCTCDSSHQGSSCSAPFIECPTVNDKICSDSGSCNNQTGICTCDSSHQSTDCSLPFIQCPGYNGQICNGQGTCLNTTGVCECKTNYQGADCSLPFIECNSNCSDHGTCNQTSGECECYTNPYSWGGKNCETILHYLSSIEPSEEGGGNATFYGWFGDIHDGLKVLIGNKECFPISQISNSSIQCWAQPGKGEHLVTIIQNSNYWNSSTILYRYLKSSLNCPNNCTNPTQGECNYLTGYCNCFGNYKGADCNGLGSNLGEGKSLESSSNENELPQSESKVDEDTSTTAITNEKTKYEIYIESLVEIDIIGTPVTTHQLEKNWIKINESNKLVHIFTQTIQNQCTINYTIEEIQGGDKEFSFADKKFMVMDGSVKMNIEITNYQYKSNLNTLQLLMKSSVKTINTNHNKECNDKATEIDTINTNDKNSLDIITIKKDSKILYGRFLDRMISDNKITPMLTTVISKDSESITLAMNIPHSVKSVIIDPDFSVVLSTSFKSSCSSNKKSWLIPVSVSIPIVGCAVLISIALLLYRKNIEATFKKKIMQISSNNK